MSAESAKSTTTSMASTDMPEKDLEELLSSFNEIIIANKNSPKQNVVAGDLD